MRGIVTNFDKKLGYGFIRNKEKKDQIYFHYSDLECEEPCYGDEVEFEIEQRLSPCAVKIHLVADDSQPEQKNSSQS
jgi:cold shock CspA family protein